MHSKRKHLLVALAAVFCLLAGPATAKDDWSQTLARARGQTVYWQAWAGDETVNRYIVWVAGEVARRYGVALRHVKIADTSEAVTQLMAERSAGRTSGGRVDLLWLNGENFATLKQNGLLFGPFAQDLPNFALVDTVHKPTTLRDFTLPTEGFESPWGMAQIVFIASASVSEPPRTMEALTNWIHAHTGRFTYPAPPDFTGTTFLKQVLLDATAPQDRPLLYAPVTEDAFQRLTQPLWRTLEALRPDLWRKGAVFPRNYPAMRTLMADNEIDIAFSFNPAEAASAIAQKLLPPNVHTFVLDGGTIGNTHFVAIPASASAKEGAMVVADFLLSPEAQARKADPRFWGDPTVLDLGRLAPDDRARFDALPPAAAMPRPEELKEVLPEPDPSWARRIEQEWQRHFSR
jgi:putative thiamine transport system substrate-binding protein